LRDRLAGPSDPGLLAGDRREVAHRAFNHLGVPSRAAAAHVDPDLGDRRHLHDGGDPALFTQHADNRGAVALLEARDRSRFQCGGHQMSSPVRRATRTFVPSSSMRYPIFEPTVRFSVLPLTSTSASTAYATFDTWIGASSSMMPPGWLP